MYALRIHFATFLGILCLVAPLSAFALTSDIHFAPSGSITGKDILVFQRSGGNIFARAVWGTAFIRFVITTDGTTVITKDHGEKATVDDIKDGDIIHFEGQLATGADSLIVKASSIQDSSLQTASQVLSGTITKVNTIGTNFNLSTKSLGDVLVRLQPDASIKKGARTISLGDLSVGDKVLTVSGTYDYTTRVLMATNVEVYQDDSVFRARNFQGTLKSISGAELPVTMVVTVGDTDYTVYVAKGSAVLRNSRAAASLSRYLAGDTVRFWGAIRRTNLTEVDAEVIRDISF